MVESLHYKQVVVGSSPIERTLGECSLGLHLFGRKMSQQFLSPNISVEAKGIRNVSAKHVIVVRLHQPILLSGCVGWHVCLRNRKR